MPNSDDNLTLTFYIKDPESDGTGDCETFYETDRGSWIVQSKITGPEVRDQLVGLAPDETYGEMSGRTVDAFVKKYVKERHGIDLG
ncbi:hypothetical protein SAMN05428985_11047 [Nocardioides sp. YR527]|uniref:hypothetical protein n=1 Tax=Nocardioides sp. YR527 TaxID=1881028 RepID=UPI00088FC41A|nr:hypothetical protein [Nocardioides sp. YR527]SDL14649.1 hypothetical protein SAMN05428985_11047 [Nocardioides sp. YR527]